ncbi:MAG: hypothetical protein ACOC4C_03935, partial [Fibrobacterota bacterium]
MNHKVYTFFLLSASIILSLSTTSCAFPKFFGFLNKDKNQTEEIEKNTSPATYLDTLNKGNEIALSSSDLNSSVLTPSATSERQQTAGYRIQCSASTELDAIRAQKDKLEKQFNMPVYIVHADPYYK